MTLLAKSNSKKLRILWGGVSLAYPFFVYFYGHKLGVIAFLYPVIVNFIVAGVFAFTLKYPPTMVERIARISEPDLDESGIQYTRYVTFIWVLFLLMNGCISLGTALYGDHHQWVLYNGCISYILMGLLLAGEIIVRQFHKRSKKI